MMCFSNNRSISQTTDVWSNLERNWIHFFWLTGETPHSLSKLVEKLEPIYNSHSTPGKDSALDFKNKVSFANVCIDLNLCYL